MSTNPFDDPDTNYSVLVNTAGEHSLWPASLPEPAGWRVAHGPAGRASCLDYVGANWRGPRPLSAAAGHPA